MVKCTSCHGNGYILTVTIGHPKGDKLRIERCDTCLKFKTDRQARQIYKAKKSAKDHFNKWFNKFLRSDNVVRNAEGWYLTQCTGYNIPMNLKQLKKYYNKEYYKQQF